MGWEILRLQSLSRTQFLKLAMNYLTSGRGVTLARCLFGLVTRLRRYLLRDDFFQVLFLLFPQILKFLQLTC